MRFEIDGQEVFASTGGRQHNPGQNWMIFIHGAGGSHVVWSQQVRAFAYDNFNVLACDFPGHGQSAGEPLDSVEDMTGWLLKVMDKIGIDKAHLVGHSLGGLVCLELAARQPDRADTITLIASALKIRVSEKLIEWASTDSGKAYQFMHFGFYGPYGHKHDGSVPGASLIGSSMQIMASNAENALAADLTACAHYENGNTAAGKIKCPTLCLLSGLDVMVPTKYGEQLCEVLANCQQHTFMGAGHMIPAERPRQTNQMMRQFYQQS